MNAPMVAELALAPGVIGIAPAPWQSGWRAAYEAWRPDIVVGLTQAHEAPAGFEWAQTPYVHWPIVDYGVPERGDWADLAARLHAGLDRGDRVLLHCRGGCGRSGMVFLRLLIERGEEGAAALARVRAVRPCAVETEAQMAWAMAPTMVSGQ